MNNKMVLNVNFDYIIGVPSGEIIDIKMTDINNLRQSGFISYDSKLGSYIFKDLDYYNILKNLKRPEFDQTLLEKTTKFFDLQKEVKSYIILKDGSIDVDGNIYVFNKKYTHFPFIFNNIKGHFVFINCELESLKGSPKNVLGDFDVSFNRLQSLMGGPKYVMGDYICKKNILMSLAGLPEVVIGNFDFSNNFIDDFIKIPEVLKGKLIYEDNPVTYYIK